MVDKMKKSYYAALAYVTILAMGSPIYCDKISEATQQAAEGLQETVVGALKWLIMIALVVGGLILAFGSDRKSEEVKERAPRMGIGIIMIVGASAIAATIFGWF